MASGSVDVSTTSDDDLWVQRFAENWKVADQTLADSEKVCTNVWEDHKRLDFLRQGQFGRTLHVLHVATSKTAVLKLYSMKSLSRGEKQMPPQAGACGTLPPSEKDLDFDENEVARRVLDLRLERILLHCLADPCPYVAVIAEDYPYTCVYDEKEGELGHPVADGVTTLRKVWDNFDFMIEDKESHEVMMAVSTACCVFCRTNGGLSTLSSQMSDNTWRNPGGKFRCRPRLVHPTGGFWKKLCDHNTRRWTRS